MTERFITFAALCRLETAELRDIARAISPKGTFVPDDKEIIARGIILPFLRRAVGVPSGSKDEVLRSAFERTAVSLGADEDVAPASSDIELITRIRTAWFERFRERIDHLDAKQRQRLIEEAAKAQAVRAREAGVAASAAASVVAAELSGFGIYMATTSSIALAGQVIGVVFPFAVYQGATTFLGVVLGPIGWVLAGGSVLFTAAKWLEIWWKQEELRLQTVVIGVILGLSPWLWFELTVDTTRKALDTAYKAASKSTHPDTIAPGTPSWMRAQLTDWFITSTVHRKTIIKAMEADAS